VDPFREERVEGFADRAHADELALAGGLAVSAAAVGRPQVRGLDVRLGQDAAPEPHLRRLADSEVRLGNAADLAGEPHLAEHRRGGGNDPVADARRDRREHAEVRRRLVHRHPARDVHEHIVADEVEAGTLLEDREQQREPLRIDPARHPTGVPVGAGADQRLHLDEDRA